MGIRFACHVCSKKLNIKYELAGRRGICPACSAKFRIPLEDAEKSSPVDQPLDGHTNGHTNDDQRAPAGANRLAEAEQGQTASAVSAVAAGQTLATIDTDPTSTWYVRPPSGGQYGPATGEILRQWISEGRVAATSLLWREGWPQWREAKEALPELVGRLPDATGESTAASPITVTQDRVKTAEANEFGLSEPLIDTERNGEAESTATRPRGQSRIGSERRSRSDSQTTVIVGLSMLAVGLVVALILVIKLK